MKIDELLKSLENAKIDERHEITEYHDEKHKIAEYILQKFGDKLYDEESYFYIITTSGEVYDLDTYEDLLEDDPDTYEDLPEETEYISKPYIFIANLWEDYDPLLYYYPFIGKRGLLLDVYLKKHFYYRDLYADLKYIAIIIHFSSLNQAVMEVADIETIANNTNLTKLIQILLSEDESEARDDYYYEEDDEDEKINEIEEQFETHRLFGKYNLRKAEEIIKKYYSEKDRSLVDDVELIKYAYNHIFRPYRLVVYDLNTKQFQVSGNNESR